MLSLSIFCCWAAAESPCLETLNGLRQPSIDGNVERFWIFFDILFKKSTLMSSELVTIICSGCFNTPCVWSVFYFRPFQASRTAVSAAVVWALTAMLSHSTHLHPTNYSRRKIENGSELEVEKIKILIKGSDLKSQNLDVTGSADSCLKSLL